MRRGLFVFGLLAVLPGLARAQQPKLVNCRSLEAAGNFVGPDEVIVDDLVCQKAKSGTDTTAKPQAAKPLMGETISGEPTENIVDAAKAAERRVAARREKLQAEAQQNGAEAASALPPATATPAETPAPAPSAEKAADTTASDPAPTKAAEVVAAPSEQPAPGVAAAPIAAPPPTARPTPAAAVPEPSLRASAPAPAPAAKSEPASTSASASPSEPAAPVADSQSAPQSEPSAAPEIVIPSAPSSAPAATSPATARKTDSPAEVAAAPGPSVQPPAPSVPAPAPAASPGNVAAPTPPPSDAAASAAEPPQPATSGAFYDANAPKRSTNAAPQTNTGFASAEQVNAGLAPGATSIPPASQPPAPEAAASAPAPEPEPQHTTIAASRVDFDADRDRSVKVGDFAKPTEVSPDPSAEHRTSVDPSDADGFQDRQRPECTKNISLGGLKGERLVLGVPTWAAKWIEKNEKRMPEICFSETPMKTARNYLIVFSTPAGSANSKDIGNAALNPAKGSGAAGVGTFTTSFGSTWHYSYDRNVGTTVLTQDDADEPHGQPGQVLYATAYTEEGVPVSQRWPGQPKKEIKPGEKNKKKLKGEAEALEHVSDDLLNDMVEDIQKF